MSENRLAEYVINNVGHIGHWSKVESPDTSAGIPDINFCIEGVEGWIELKYGVSGGKMPVLRPTQCAWFRRRVNAGKGRPTLLVKIDIWYGLIEGHHVPALVHAKTEQEWKRPCKIIWENKIDWGEFIQEILTRR